MSFAPPVCEVVDGFTVVRDDLLPGGTKARFIFDLFPDCSELVYASPQEGGAQTGLAIAAKVFNRRFTLFVGTRKIPHERVALSERLGAKIMKVKPGYLSTVQAVAQRYVNRERFNLVNLDTYNLYFGLESKYAVEVISSAAKKIPKPRELWFCAGSGTLAKGLAAAWPDVPRFAIQISHQLTTKDVAGATIIPSQQAFGDKEEFPVPFPSDPHYDAKAWKMMLERRKASDRTGITFWNVAGPASSYEQYCNESAVEILRAKKTAGRQRA